MKGDPKKIWIGGENMKLSLGMIKAQEEAEVNEDKCNHGYNENVVN